MSLGRRRLVLALGGVVLLICLHIVLEDQGFFAFISTEKQNENGDVTLMMMEKKAEGTREGDVEMRPLDKDYSEKHNALTGVDENSGRGEQVEVDVVRARGESTDREKRGGLRSTANPTPGSPYSNTPSPGSDHTESGEKAKPSDKTVLAPIETTSVTGNDTAPNKAHSDNKTSPSPKTLVQLSNDQEGSNNILIASKPPSSRDGDVKRTGSVVINTVSPTPLTQIGLNTTSLPVTTTIPPSSKPSDRNRNESVSNNVTSSITSSSKVHLITYASSGSYVRHAEALVRSAYVNATCNLTATIYHSNDIDPDFYNRNNRTFKVSRGAGLWVWKPYIVRKKLREIGDNELLVYVDARYLFERDVCSLMCPDSDYMCFDRKAGSLIKHLDVKFNKMDAYILMDMKPDPSHIQPWAGFVMFRKTNRTLQFVDEWVKYAEDYRIISFDKSVLAPENRTIFYQNRNDQTILSLLLQKNNMTCSELPLNWLYNIRWKFTR